MRRGTEVRFSVSQYFFVPLSLAPQHLLLALVGSSESASLSFLEMAASVFGPCRKLALMCHVSLSTTMDSSSVVAYPKMAVYSASGPCRKFALTCHVSLSMTMDSPSVVVDPKMAAYSAHMDSSDTSAMTLR